jgi:hypothetical protein
MAAAILAGGAAVFAEGGGSVPYPVEYRMWAVTKSFVAPAESRNAGFHHYYANEKALEGFTTGRFPDGSVIVDERLEVEQRGGGSAEGKRMSVSVMRKDSQRYAETGGWGFDTAAGESKTLAGSAEVRAACYSCHSKQKDRDFVFSAFRQ